MLLSAVVQAAAPSVCYKSEREWCCCARTCAHTCAHTRNHVHTYAQVRVYAFGAPRAGNHAFARAYARTVPDTW